LNSEDSDISQIAQNFFGLNSDIINAIFEFPQSLVDADIEISDFKFRLIWPSESSSALLNIEFPKNKNQNFRTDGTDCRGKLNRYLIEYRIAKRNLCWSKMID
jgi:hypothetical protein